MRIRFPLLVFLAFGPGCSKRGPPPPAGRAAEEACVDGWLKERGLDPYGSPEGTIYAGGTPLFDERTGQSTGRLEYVYRQHPLARQACLR